MNFFVGNLRHQFVDNRLNFEFLKINQTYHSKYQDLSRWDHKQHKKLNLATINFQIKNVKNNLMIFIYLNRSRSQLRVFQPQFSEEARQGLVCPRWIPQRRQSWKSLKKFNK